MNFESSMSQVAATMGITSAEIAAGSEDFEILEKAAKDAGASTQFSASQAADALNYLALAGYDAATAADVLPSVLNLAAAGGMDLAYASDLATDAMAALGIEASNENLTHFGDELSKTAQKSNTSVSQLGEAILVCAGTAKNTGQSLETLNTALGVMANRGIKGSEGGTHLRNVLLSLTAPTDTAKKKLNSLGVTVADSEGNIRSLDDILGDLKESLSGMSEEARTNALSEIFNKTDISAINALLDGMGTEWDELKKNVSNADGAMADMAETMNDNLKGKLTILSSALEGLGIAVYEGIEDPLKEAVDSATDNIGRLSSSITEGELQGALQNVGTLLGTLASDVASGLSTAAQAAISVLSVLGEHLDLVTSAAAGTLAAFVAFKAIASITAVIEGLKTAFAALNAVLMANPAGIVVAAIAGLSVAIGTATKKIKEAYEETEEYKKSNTGLKETIDSTKEAIEGMHEAQTESITAGLTEVERIQRLSDELRTLTDENGNVKSGYEERVNFILGELNSALGTEYSLIDGQIQKYQELEAEIDNVILKKRAMTVLDAMEDSYSQAITGQTEALQVYGTAQQKVIETQQQINDLKKRQSELEEELASGTEMNTEATIAELSSIQSEINKLNPVLESYQNTAQDAFSNVQSYSETLSDYETLSAAITSGNYEQMGESVNKWKAQSISASELVGKSTQEQAEIMKTEIAAAVSAVSGSWDEFSNNATAANEEAYNSAVSALSGLVQMYEEAGGNLADLAPIFNAAGIDMGTSMAEGAAEGAETGAGEVADAANDTVTTAAAQSASTAATEFQSTGEFAAQGFADGMTAYIGVIVAAATDAANAANNAFKTTLDINSPSRVMRDEVGKYVSLGVAEGITQYTYAIAEASMDAAYTAVDAAKSAADIQSYSRVMRDEVGAMLVEGLKVGITSKMDEVPEAFESMMDDIKLQLELGAINEAEYYKKLEEYRDEYLTKGSDEWWSYTKEIIKYEDELTEQQRDREFKRLENLKELRIISEQDYYRQLEVLRDEYIEKGSDDWEDYTLEIAKYWQGVMDDMASEYTDKLDAVHDKMDSLKDKLSSGFSLSHSVTLTLEKQGVEYDQSFNVLNTDIDAYTQEVKQWCDVMEQLRDREGIADGYMEQLMTEDAATAYQLAEQMLRMSDEDFKKYMDSYSEYTSAIDRYSKEFFKDEEREIATAAEGYADSFVDGIQDGLSDLDEIMSLIGYSSAEAFANEFKQQISDAMVKVQEIIAGTGEGIYLGGMTGTGASYQYNTYQLNSSGETVAQQLRVCRDAAMVERLRGGYE